MRYICPDCCACGADKDIKERNGKGPLCHVCDYKVEMVPYNEWRINNKVILLIYDDGTIEKTNTTISALSHNTSEKSVILIVDITNPSKPCKYKNGKWVEIKSIEKV